MQRAPGGPGLGQISLLLIHGGLASRASSAPQLAALSDRFRTAALDLAGHGTFGLNRQNWTIQALGGDVRGGARWLMPHGIGCSRHADAPWDPCL